MSHHLVNETSIVVEHEIDQFLLEFPEDHPFVMALSIPYFRQQLKAKVLNKIPNRHKIGTETTPEFMPAHRFMGILKERLAIEEKIRWVMPELINNVKSNASPNYLATTTNQHNGNNSPQWGTDWWVKVHTIIPCVTYYFGPFTDEEEARTAHPGYIEDLKEEKAIGIFAEIQQGQPHQLTVVDSVTELKQDQHRLWNNYKKVHRQKSAIESSFRKLLELLPGNYLVVDRRGKIQDANQNACRLLNIPLASLVGENLVYYVPQQQIILFEDHLEAIVLDRDYWKEPYRWSMHLQSSSIDPINVDIQVTQKRDEQGKITGFYWLLNDTTSLNTINDQLYYDSRHDTLTLLPNRRSLANFLEELPHDNSTGQSHRDQLFALLMLDLNKFKKINDQYGHIFGDKVLQKVADNLLKCVRDGDRVARLSGDEFMIVLRSIQSMQEAKKCAYRIHEVFSHPIIVEGKELSVSTSIGIVISNGKQFDRDRLVHYADTAMYEAKRKGMLFVVFDDSQPSSNGKSHPVPIHDLSLMER